ncbi:unnamed protein product [Rhizoctonia solani]|uniref:Potassium transport protein n=1 Tax=Rhizoctonia solani TaxID=456999 RepID=A0A8H2Y5G9_9AGAM|nr:unnamed protein product [Rhizoctonia solani]
MNPVGDVPNVAIEHAPFVDNPRLWEGLPSQTNRYDDVFAGPRAARTMMPGSQSALTNVDGDSRPQLLPVPEGWVEFIHPVEGRPYYYNSELRVVTETYLRHPNQLAFIEEWYSVFRELRNRVLPSASNLDVFLDCDGRNTCRYYMIDHANKTICWLRQRQTSDIVTMVTLLLVPARVAALQLTRRITTHPGAVQAAANPRHPWHYGGRAPFSKPEAITLREPGTGDFPRTQTIEFANPPQVRGRAGTRRQSAGVNSERERERARFRNFSLGGSSNIAPASSDAGDTNSANIGVGTSSIGHGYTSGRGRASSTGRQRMGSVSTAYFPRTATGRSYATTRMNLPAQVPSNQSGYGGFPMPHELAGRAIKRFFPQTMTLTRTLTIGSGGAEPREVPYITFDAIVGRNWVKVLNRVDEQDELGGVEYRALGALLWIIAAYHFGVQLFGFVVFAPYSSMSKWAPVFREQQHRFVPPTWFSAFQAVSAYTNTGMSLIDQSMVPFQTAYPMVIIIFFMILAGNTAFPIFLRFFIWLLSKVVGKRSHETLSFLLDHPRRCFTLLFPSHQTWFLLIVLVTMVITDWVSFMVLDIGNDVIEAIPVGTRIAIGLLQAGAVRAAGFATVSISALAPAVKVLYVTMMYVAVYPIALSVRATNVYEEQSLGVLELLLEALLLLGFVGSLQVAWGSYLAWHARKQLSFDMWWLAVALWLVCIIERSEIMNSESADWFNIFTIIFELVSAYGTVGLSLGLPTANYSFSGALRPLSKLIICIVMLRGRHRGLPHAIDRAVMFPWELMGHQGQSRSFNGFDASNNRQSMGGEPGPSFEAHSTGRAPIATHGVDLKHRTNTILSPVHEVLTPVTSVIGTPRATFSALGGN